MNFISEKNEFIVIQTEIYRYLEIWVKALWIFGMEANERFGKYYSGVIIEAMEGIACREMQGSREKVLGMDIFPSGLVVKNLRANAGATEDVGSIPGSRRFPGVGNGSSLQYFCLKSFMDRGAWWATFHGIAKSRTWLSSQSHTVRPMTMTSSCKRKSFLMMLWLGKSELDWGTSGSFPSVVFLYLFFSLNSKFFSTIFGCHTWQISNWLSVCHFLKMLFVF